MASGRRLFSEKFKREAVKLVGQPGASNAGISRDRRWSKLVGALVQRSHFRRPTNLIDLSDHPRPHTGPCGRNKREEPTGVVISTSAAIAVIGMRPACPSRNAGIHLPIPTSKMSCLVPCDWHSLLGV